jgi:hypothetical protein
MQTTSKKPERRYGITPDVDHLPKLTVSQKWVDEAHHEGFGAGDQIRVVTVSALFNSNWSRLSDQFYRERIVYVRSNKTLLLRFRYDYAIDLDRICCEGDLLHWILHLCGKS